MGIIIPAAGSPANGISTAIVNPSKIVIPAGRAPAGGLFAGGGMAGGMAPCMVARLVAFFLHLWDKKHLYFVLSFDLIFDLGRGMLLHLLWRGGQQLLQPLGPLRPLPEKG